VSYLLQFIVFMHLLIIIINVSSILMLCMTPCWMRLVEYLFTGLAGEIN